ncbi:MAG: RNase J family beta-CASP ribonuclease [Oscillospiraceae bacterium]|nr:RNase J family beta-CASP ribonuclease [Oscillospiraceae bacterium]
MPAAAVASLSEGDTSAAKDVKKEASAQRTQSRGRRSAQSREELSAGKEAAKEQPAQKTAARRGRPASRQQSVQKDSEPQGRRGKEKKPSVRIIPLGGLNEIGKNMTAYEAGNDILIVDCGMGFPDADMLGVDLVIPDFTWLEKNVERIRGLLITHGHEDHIGSIPYFLKKLGTQIPIYGARLTLGLIEGKLKEHGLLGKANLNVVKPGDVVRLGCFSAEFIRVNHSIPDAMAIAITTPAGVIVQTGDFKVDYTPIQGEMIDLARFSELGQQGVLCLLSDSTNAERPGYTESERNVGRAFEALFTQAGDRRIIIASFSSNIHRIQQIVDLAARTGRKVAVSGRSMINVVAKAIELGYLTVPKDVLIDVDNIGRYNSSKLVIVTTGSQGEPMSALSRMASGEHRKVQITSNDYIIISAKPIPGNEKHVTRVINDLLKLGAEVVYRSMYEVHVSGHACQNELKMMLSMVKPKFFIPVHGEYLHLTAHAHLARDLGIAPDHILITDIGQVIELTPDTMQVTGTVEAGRVFVDGYGVGDVGSIVLRDRQHLAQDGLIIVVVTIESESGAVVAGPDIVSRGFVYVRESEELMETARRLVKSTLEECQEKGMREWSAIKISIKDRLSSFIYKKTKRDPMILPIIMEI